MRGHPSIEIEAFDTTSFDDSSSDTEIITELQNFMVLAIIINFGVLG